MTSFEKLFSEIKYDVIPDDFTWDKYNRVIDEKRKIKADKSLLEAESVEYDIEKCGNCLPETRFFTNIGSAHFEGFFNKGTDDQLIVFFDGARTAGNMYTVVPLPRFVSWSWCSKSSSSILCLEDPMYYLFDECILAWFYGTPQENFREYAARIIKKIASNLGLSYDKIILYGRSGGGTAAVGTSEFIDGCSVVSVNMQVDIENYYYTPHFERITGITLSTDDPRIDIASIIEKNKNNKYFVLTNAASGSDFGTDLKILGDHFGVKPTYGINFFDNMICWVYEAYGCPLPHTAFENYYIFSLILTVIKAYNSGVDKATIKSFVEIINEYWYEKYIGQSKAYKLDKEIEKLQAENQKLKADINDINAKYNTFVAKRKKNIFVRLFRKIKRVLKRIFK